LTYVKDRFSGKSYDAGMRITYTSEVKYHYEKEEPSIAGECFSNNHSGSHRL
jgi:hypothetical protein